MIKVKEVTFYDLIGKYEDSQIRVPDYQRGYSWENNHVIDFFDENNRGQTTVFYGHLFKPNRIKQKYFLSLIMMKKKPWPVPVI